jgi:hypothetical protein
MKKQLYTTRLAVQANRGCRPTRVFGSGSGLFDFSPSVSGNSGSGVSRDPQLEFDSAEQKRREREARARGEVACNYYALAIQPSKVVLNQSGTLRLCDLGLICRNFSILQAQCTVFGVNNAV